MSVSSGVMMIGLKRYRTHTNFYIIYHPPVEWCQPKLRKPKSAIKPFTQWTTENKFALRPRSLIQNSTATVVIKMDTNCGSLEQAFSLKKQNATLLTTFSMPALEEIKHATNKTHQYPQKKFH